MSVSREDLLAAADDDSNERFIGFIAKHVSDSQNLFFLLSACNRRTGLRSADTANYGKCCTHLESGGLASYCL